MERGVRVLVHLALSVAWRFRVDLSECALSPMTGSLKTFLFKADLSRRQFARAPENNKKGELPQSLIPQVREMSKVISFDMDGTLVSPRYVDKVWMEGVPLLYAKRHGVDPEAAKEIVIGEYLKIGSDRLEWYDLKYWLERFDLNIDKYELLEMYRSEIEIYPEVETVLDSLRDAGYQLIVTSNAAREFIEMELDGLMDRFSKIFSVTTDFRDVKKSPRSYILVCRALGRRPLEVLHIGDHYIYDYEAPIEAGLDALFLDRKGNRRGPEVVGDLHEAADRISNCI